MAFSTDWLSFNHFETVSPKLTTKLKGKKLTAVHPIFARNSSRSLFEAGVFILNLSAFSLAFAETEFIDFELLESMERVDFGAR